MIGGKVPRTNHGHFDSPTPPLPPHDQGEHYTFRETTVLKPNFSRLRLSLSMTRDDSAVATKIRKLETSESLAILQSHLIEQRSSVTTSHGGREPPANDPLAVRVAVQRGRLVLVTLVAVLAVATLTLCFSRRGVVIETFERSAVSISDQEKLLEKYNAYSGTIAGLFERPVEMFMGLAMRVVVLRLMANNVLQAERRWGAGATAFVLGAGGTYLLSNGLTAVNVQVREQPIRSAISAEELTLPVVDPSKTSTMDKSYTEDRPGNPATNTILRNLILSRAMETRGTCSDRSEIDSFDAVDYRIPQYPWMKYLLAEAVAPKSIKIDVSRTNTPENAGLRPEQLNMNVSVAADLLVYSHGNGDAWDSNSQGSFNRSVANQFFRKSQGDSKTANLYGPTARLWGLLPRKLGTTEQEDREWFLKNSGPIMYNNSGNNYRNASLRSWTMTFSRVDIVPGSVWVDAVTVEREAVTPRLQTNTSKDGTTRYLALEALQLDASRLHVSFRKPGGVRDEKIEMYGVCTDRNGFETLTSSMFENDTDTPSIECRTQSNRSLLFLSRGKRLVADELIENATVRNGELVRGEGFGVVVNLREIFTTTTARITWTAQNLSKIYNARCDSSDGCMGFDVPLPGSGQRLVVNASTLPLALAPPPVDNDRRGTDPLPIVSVRRPQSFQLYHSPGGDVYIGDILMPHNIRNLTVTPQPPSGSCDSTGRSRMVTYVNNHMYIESTLQPTYTAAAFFLFQGGVTRDVLAKSSTDQTMLAFKANVQDVDVYVYVPWLNVLLTLAGCVLLVVTVTVVVLWPYVVRRSGAESDPLEHITEPHTIASVLLNESAYPPLLLARTVVDSDSSAADGRANADEFVVHSLSLRRKGVYAHGDGV